MYMKLFHKHDGGIENNLQIYQIYNTRMHMYFASVALIINPNYNVCFQ